MRHFAAILTVLLIGLAIVPAAAAVDVTINWPFDTEGYWEFKGVTGKFGDTQTVSLEDGVYNLNGAGWDATKTQIEVAGGQATLIRNDDNVGIVDNGDNSFTFKFAPLTVDNQRLDGWWEVPEAKKISSPGMSTILLVPAPSYDLNGPTYTRFGFSLAEDGTVTLSDSAPDFASVVDDVIVLTDTITQVTFNWPEGTAGYWQVRNMTSKIKATDTVPLNNSTHDILGAGWNGTHLKIDVADGVASLSVNTDNVGIVDNGDNSFTFESATVTVVNERSIYYEITEVVGKKWIGTEQYTLVTAPGYSFKSPDVRFHFGITSDGTATLADDAPEWVLVDGSTITIPAKEYTIDPHGSDLGWESAAVRPNDTTETYGGVTTGTATRFLSPGTYRVVLHGTAGDQEQQFTINADWTVTGGEFPFIDDGNLVAFSVTSNEPVQQRLLDGDANLDCKVNIIDLIFIRNRLNQDVASDDNWQADLNEDGKINIIDLIYARNRLNSSCN